MNPQPHPRNAIRMLAAIGVLLTVVTSTALAVRLLDAPAKSKQESTFAAVAAPTATRAEGSSIDYSVVNRDGPDASPEDAGMSIAAYGS